MKILLFGKNGQIGWELLRSLAPLGEIIAPEKDSRDLCGDLANSNGISKTIRATMPDVIVNAAAYTAVDKAEKEQEHAFAINAKAPEVIAREAATCGAWFVDYSTDYVFNGESDRPWIETDLANPLNVYGESKLRGEKEIQKSGCRFLIFRTSWIYATHGDNFVKTILRLAKDRDTLSVVDDQIGSPTGAELVADVTAHALRHILKHPGAGGLYHLSARGETSWNDYARFIVYDADRKGFPLKTKKEAIAAIPSSSYPAPAKRPLNSRLDASKLEQTFGLNLPDWRPGVEHVLSELIESQSK